MSLVDPKNDRPEFDHVPTLRELLKETAGLPGVTYAQVCAHNAEEAQAQGWGSVQMKYQFYRIVGPQGTVGMTLACKGSPIPGMGPHSGARRMLVDDDVYAKTGLWLGQRPLTDEEPTIAQETSQEKPQAEDKETSLGVQVPSQTLDFENPS